MPVKRITVIVLDSVGCGDAPDAAAYGDAGADTIGNMSRVVGGLHLPNLCQLGLGHTTDILGVPPVKFASGAYG
jgi:phosphopentomutase